MQGSGEKGKQGRHLDQVPTHRLTSPRTFRLCSFRVQVCPHLLPTSQATLTQPQLAYAQGQERLVN